MENLPTLKFPMIHQLSNFPFESSISSEFTKRMKAHNMKIVFQTRPWNSDEMRLWLDENFYDNFC